MKQNSKESDCIDCCSKAENVNIGIKICLENRNSCRLIDWHNFCFIKSRLESALNTYQIRDKEADKALIKRFQNGNPERQRLVNLQQIITQRETLDFQSEVVVCFVFNVAVESSVKKESQYSPVSPSLGKPSRRRITESFPFTALGCKSTHSGINCVGWPSASHNSPIYVQRGNCEDKWDMDGK